MILTLRRRRWLRRHALALEFAALMLGALALVAVSLAMLRLGIGWGRL